MDRSSSLVVAVVAVVAVAEDLVSVLALKFNLSFVELILLPFSGGFNMFGRR